ncbi:10439_t:CDS:2 [Funneliformis geosporum]|uniref:6509_t:CDS:1 n=1 Tax=Funneliformis geosporum TaxID=1117311 RepID=A0A9W4SWM7_9GLOM|nr:10439_t:CDS:2 [Funneliformis geosporum]CAI2184155.1 6509_t:CDS:2 [Funneliformis geosporum]
MVLSSIKDLPIECTRTFNSHQSPVHIARYNTGGEYVLSGGQDRTIRLWNPETGLNIKTYTGHGKEVLDLSVTQDNSRFASCGGDRQIYYWDVSTGTTVRRFEGHNQRVNAVSFNWEGTVLASGSYDTTIRLWDCRSHSRAPIQILEEPKDSITSLHVIQYEIVSGSADGCIRTHDIRMGALITDLISHPVTSVRVSGDNNCILASSLDNSIRLMDRANGGLLNEFKGHKNASYKIHSCLSNNDAHVISGSEDGQIYIWDLLEGNLLTSFKAHSNVVTCVTIHPRYDYMISTSVDGTAKYWKPQNI